MTTDPKTAYHITALDREIGELEPRVDAAWNAYQVALDDMDRYRALHAPIHAHAQWQICLELRQTWDTLEDQIAALAHKRYIALTQQADLHV